MTCIREAHRGFDLSKNRFGALFREPTSRSLPSEELSCAWFLHSDSRRGTTTFNAVSSRSANCVLVSCFVEIGLVLYSRFVVFGLFSLITCREKRLVHTSLPSVLDENSVF